MNAKHVFYVSFFICYLIKTYFMKKTLLLFISTFFLFQFSFAQKNKNDNLQSEDSLLSFSISDFGQEACKCVDSVTLSDKGNKDINKEIKKCIDKEVVVYQMTDKMNAALKSGNLKDINISLQIDEKSDEYKKYYYDLERWLRDSCTSVNTALKADDKSSDRSFSKNPEATYQYNQGIKLFNKEDYKKAIPFFRQAVQVDPNFAFAWDNLGVCFRKTDQLDSAIYAYKKSLEIDPKGHMPLQNIGVAYEFKKEYDKALEAYKNLALYYPDDPETFYGMGRIYTFYKNDLESGLDNMCMAYTIYTRQSSPYRSDAEKQITYIYAEMKKQGKESKFKEILKKNNINPDFKD